MNWNLSHRSTSVLGVGVVDGRPLGLLIQGVAVLQCSVRLRGDDVTPVMNGTSFAKQRARDKMDGLASEG